MNLPDEAVVAPIVVPLIAPPLISTVLEVNVLPFAIVNPLLADNKPLVDNVVNLPDEAVVAPIVVPSIAPPSISTLVDSKFPTNFVAFTLPLTSNLYPVVGLVVPIPTSPDGKIVILELERLAS